MYSDFSLNTPRLCSRVEDSFLELFFNCCSTPVYIVYFVCNAASELERWALLPAFSFSELVEYFIWVFLIYIFLHLILGSDVTTEIRFFALKSKKEKVPWIEVRTVF